MVEGRVAGRAGDGGVVVEPGCGEGKHRRRVVSVAVPKLLSDVVDAVLQFPPTLVEPLDLGTDNIYILWI